MSHSTNPPLVATDGKTLRVLLICRVSDPGPEKQDERSLDDQEVMHREWLKSNTDLPIHIEVIAGDGSGERLDRDETAQAASKMATGDFDLVLCEDLGRIFRRMHAYLFCEAAEDANTRVIAINDHVDTANDGWRMARTKCRLRCLWSALCLWCSWANQSLNV